VGEAKWVGFAVVYGKNLLKFEFLWCVYGGDERRKKKSREERQG